MKSDRRATAPPCKLPTRAKCCRLKRCQELQASQKDKPLNPQLQSTHVGQILTGQTTEEQRAGPPWLSREGAGGRAPSLVPLQRSSSARHPSAGQPLQPEATPTASSQNPYLNAERLPAPGNKGQYHSWLHVHDPRPNYSWECYAGVLFHQSQRVQFLGTATSLRTHVQGRPGGHP